VTFWSKLIARRDPAQGDAALVQALRDGDEDAFASLVDAYSNSMRRLALTFVRTRAVADEVVQEAWLGVLKGIDRFEGRSSLKTWIFRITANVAKTRAEREARSVPFSSLEPAGDEPSVDPDRFFKPGESGPTGGWSSPPESWQALPEERLLAAETRLVIERAIDDLPPSQRAVITLRDVQGFSSDEVRNVLDLSETNQRVLLHRARSKVRAALEDYVHAQA
jgi:RNA polymerase sigma-70 factor (ECF subfamily)